MRSVSHFAAISARAAACGVAWLLLVAPAAVRADGGGTIYQWTDSTGAYRYTPNLDRVPGSARNTVLTIQTGDEGPSNEPIYFEPDPRASEVAVPEPAVETASSPVVVSPLESEPNEREARIRELESEIAQLEEQLKAYISEPGAPPGADVEIPPELREAAARLPVLQADLAVLQRRPESARAP
jgi:hypothetical protein